MRVHPLFWLVGVILGANADADGISILIWVSVLFASILIHELGHAFTMRYYGAAPRVVLYMMGGLAICDSSSFGGSPKRSHGPQQQIIISAAGPGAGFLFALFIVALLKASGSEVWLVKSFPIFWSFRLPESASPYLYELVHGLLFINILWGLVNLLPIYPLDGGQISRELFVSNEPWHGLIQSLWVSVITAGIVAAYGVFLASQSSGSSGLFLALMFGSLAFFNWQVLQQMSGRGGGGYGGGGFGGGPWGGGGNPW